MRQKPLKDSLERARSQAAWQNSPDYKRARIIVAAFLLWGLIAGCVVVVAFFSDPAAAFPKVTLPQVGGVAFALLYIAFFSFYAKSYRSQQRRKFNDKELLRRYGDLGDKEASLLEQDDLQLGDLWRLTEERLRLYHEIATRQAQASFRNAQWAIGGGFIVVIGSACIAFFARNATITVVIGVMGTSGAALSAYVGRTFLRLQENAAAHLRSYFDQPQEHFRYLAAERLLSSIKNGRKRDSATLELIRSIVLSGSIETQK